MKEMSLKENGRFYLIVSCKICAKWRWNFINSSRQWISKWRCGWPDLWRSEKIEIMINDRLFTLKELKPMVEVFWQENLLIQPHNVVHFRLRLRESNQIHSCKKLFYCYDNDHFLYWSMPV